MKKYTSFLLFLLVTQVSISAWAGERAQDLLQKSLSALGGHKAWSEVKAIVLKGEGEAFSLPAQFRSVSSGENHKHISIQTAIYQLERGYDGRFGWERMAWQGAEPASAPYVRQLAPFVLERFVQENWTPPIYAYVRDGLKAEYLGIKLIKNTDFHAVRVFFESGKYEDIYLDRNNYLPVERRFVAHYENGSQEVSISYNDYRKVDAIYLPNLIIGIPQEVGAGPVVINVQSYDLNGNVDRSQFQYVKADKLSEPYELSLGTVPFKVYKEHDWFLSSREWDISPNWATAIAPTETWTFDLTMDERHGRWVDPVSAVLDLFSAGKKVRTITLSREELATARRLSVARYSGLGAVSVFRQHWTATLDLEVDLMTYTLTAKNAMGELISATESFPVSRYEQKNKLIFPIKGPFIIFSAHDYNDINHKDEWSQWGAYDIVALGDRLEVLHRPGGHKAADHVTYGHDVIAPADGTVIYARNDVPGGRVPKDVRNQLPDTMNVGPGNHIIIDHGNSEYSFFCHLQLGSVVVKKGDRVKQGQSIARLGDSMSADYPHLHFQMMNGPISLRADGIPSRFENVELAFPTPGLGLKIDVPKRGYYLIAK